MKRERYERWLALHVEGDLPARDVAALERHLAGCESCRAFRRGLEQSQSHLKSLASEPLDDRAVEETDERETAGLPKRDRPSPHLVVRALAISGG